MSRLCIAQSNAAIESLDRESLPRISSKSFHSPLHPDGSLRARVALEPNKNLPPDGERIAAGTYTVHRRRELNWSGRFGG